jgi:hypothetical protein
MKLTTKYEGSFMERLKQIVVIGVLILIAGCAVRSVYPLFEYKDIVPNPAIIGTWNVEESKDTYIFRQSGDKQYELLYFEEEYNTISRGHQGAGDTAMFDIQLGKIGDSWFMDVYPEEKTQQLHLRNTIYNHHQLRTHTFAKIQIDGDSMKVAPLESDWVEQLADSGKVPIPYVRTEGEVLFTASPQELQSFILKYVNEEKAFPHPGRFYRVK